MFMLCIHLYGIIVSRGVGCFKTGDYGLNILTRLSDPILAPKYTYFINLSKLSCSHRSRKLVPPVMMCMNSEIK